MNLVLPFPPSVNGYWRSFRGRNILSAKGREYRKAAVGAAALAGTVGSTARLSVRVLLMPPDKRRRDLDNYLKGPLDALTHAGVYGDDSQIDVLRIERGEIHEGGALLVEILKIKE